MAIAITSITVNDILDKRISLQNAAVARKLSIGTDWQRIRVGARITMTDPGFALGSIDSHFWMGVMSNSVNPLSNGPLGVNTSNFVGIRTVGSNWVRATSPHIHMNGASNQGISTYNYILRNGNTNVVGSSSTTLKFNNVPHLRLAYIVEIVKGDSWQVNRIGTGSTNTGALIVDISQEILITAMEQGTIQNVANTLNLFVGGTGNRYIGSSGALFTPPDEIVNGPINSVVLAWNKSLTTMHVSEILWAKME